MKAGSSNPNAGHDRRRTDHEADGLARAYGDALRAANSSTTERIALECLREGMTVEALYGSVITPAMWRIGELWEMGAITVADEHLATATTHRVMANVFGTTLIRAAPRPGKILLAAPQNQHHALGLRMVGDVLELAGYEVIYLGGDVPLDALVASIASHQPDLVGLSTTLATDLPTVELAVAELRKAFPATPILLGGQAVPERSSSHDGVTYARDIVNLVPLVEGLLAGTETNSREGSWPSERPDRPTRPIVTASETDSPEGRLLEATAETAELARQHARMAHSFRRLAYEDPITMGPNRRAFDDRLALLGSSSEASPSAILMLDLDGFKQVNDTLGHAAGDTVLSEVAVAIDGCLRKGDFAARLGGDEFAMLLPNTDIAEAEEVASRVLASVSAAGTEEAVTAAIGIAPLDGDSRHTMLEADLALYAAKAAGGNRVRISGKG